MYFTFFSVAAALAAQAPGQEDLPPANYYVRASGTDLFLSRQPDGPLSFEELLPGDST